MFFLFNITLTTLAIENIARFFIIHFYPLIFSLMDFEEVLSFAFLRLNSALIHVANSKAISLCANVPPPRPFFEIIPTAYVVSIHRCGVKEKLLRPALFLNPSDSMDLNPGLLIFFHNLKILLYPYCASNSELDKHFYLYSYIWQYL